MPYNNLTTELADNILTIQINRPEVMNALNIETISELSKIFDEVEDNNDIRGIIITGAGDKSFVAGADIAEFADFSTEEGTKMSQKGHDAFNKIENCSKPVIAAVNGFALGGGCELAMACHIRVASEKAKFGQPEVGLGIIPGYGGTQRLTMLVGKGRAMELIMTGDIVNANDALNIGLVNHVTEANNLLPKAEEILQKIFKKSPSAITKTISCINSTYKEGGYDMEIKEFGNCFNTQDFKEGTTAFLEKRKPEFVY